MIVGAAICPGAPFLVEGFATAIARTVPDLVAACGEALDRLPPADRTLLIGSRLIGSRGAGPDDGSDPSSDPPSTPIERVYPPGAEVRTVVTRSDIAGAAAVGLPGGGVVGRWGSRRGSDADHLGAGRDAAVGTAGRAAAEPSVAILVGAHLMRAAQHAVPTWALEVSPAVSSAGHPPELNTDGPDRVTVLVIADGAACHGDNAPGRRDDRSDAFDAALARALAAGDPAALADACRNPELPADAVMASVNPLALLADLTRSAPPDAADLLYSGAPFGVGYFVASWRWNQA